MTIRGQFLRLNHGSVAETDMYISVNLIKVLP